MGENQKAEEERRTGNGRRASDKYCPEHGLCVYRITVMETSFSEHLADTKKYRQKVDDKFTSSNTKLIATLTSAVLSLIGIIVILVMNLAKS